MRSWPRRSDCATAATPDLTVMQPHGRMTAALQALAAQVHETPAQVARTLFGELVRAFDEIDTGMAQGDADAVARATHAARNSVLMLDDPQMLAGLRTLETAVIRGDDAATALARSEVAGRWERLAAQLIAV
jgi:hypothetical protein